MDLPEDLEDITQMVVPRAYGKSAVITISRTGWNMCRLSKLARDLLGDPKRIRVKVSNSTGRVYIYPTKESDVFGIDVTDVGNFGNKLGVYTRMQKYRLGRYNATWNDDGSLMFQLEPEVT